MGSRTGVWIVGIILGATPFVLESVFRGNFLQIINPDNFDKYYGSIIPIMGVPCALLLAEFCLLACSEGKQVLVRGVGILTCVFFLISIVIATCTVYAVCAYWTHYAEQGLVFQASSKLPNSGGLFGGTIFAATAGAAVTYAMSKIIEKREEAGL